MSAGPAPQRPAELTDVAHSRSLSKPQQQWPIHCRLSTSGTECIFYKQLEELGWISTHMVEQKRGRSAAIKMTKASSCDSACLTEQHTAAVADMRGPNASRGGGAPWRANHNTAQ